MNQIDHRLIVVLGMHRSGTSAITSGLEALGVDLGENLLPPMPGVNEKGFFEDAHITQFNDELLKAIGSSWHALSLIENTVFAEERFAQFRLRAIELIHARAGKKLFGLKDPRISRLLPFWQPVFDEAGISVSYVIAMRNPMSIVESLKKRDGFEAEKSYYLWLEHMLPAILGTQGHQRVVVNFDSLMSQPQTQLKRMAQALGLSFNECSAPVQVYVNEFLDSKLQHTRFGIGSLREAPAASEEVIKTYELLVDMSNDQNVDVSEFNKLNARLKEMSPMFEYMTRCQLEHYELTQTILERDRQIASLTQTVMECDRHIGALTASTSWKITAPLRGLALMFRRQKGTKLFSSTGGNSGRNE